MPVIHYDVSRVSVWKEPKSYGPPEPLPKPDVLARYMADLLARDRLVAWIAERYGLTRDTLAEYGIGYLETQAGPWLTIPVRESSGALVNVRRRYVGRNARLHETGTKYCNLRGRGEPRLYPADRLPADGSPLLVCCGEWDAILFRQATGIAAVTTTGGANSWPAGWGDLARRFAVTIVYDRGEEAYADRLGLRLGAPVVHLPAGLPIGTDLADLYREGGSAALRPIVRWFA